MLTAEEVRAAARHLSQFTLPLDETWRYEMPSNLSSRDDDERVQRRINPWDEMQEALAVGAQMAYGQHLEEEQETQRTKDSLEFQQRLEQVELMLDSVLTNAIDHFFDRLHDTAVTKNDENYNPRYDFHER